MGFEIPLGDLAPGATELDEVEQRALLGLAASDPINGEKLRQWQADQDLGIDVDGKNGAQTRGVMRMFYWPLVKREITDDELLFLGRLTAQWESGSRYGAVNLNGEFEGRWPDHSFSGRVSVGLSYGLIQFTQDSGALGRVLARMNELDRAAFVRSFTVPGCAGSADDMLRMVTDPKGERAAVYGMEDGGLRSLRVRKICGHDLWKEPWLTLFRKAAEEPSMQQAQIEMMVSRYVKPAVEFGVSIGFCDRASLAVLIDSATHQGVAGMKETALKGLAKYGGRAPDRSAILDVIRAYKSSTVARTNKVRRRRVEMLRRHNPGISYC
jgi:hypothetical protein